MTCPHHISRTDGKGSSFCDACGAQTSATETRPCSACKHYKEVVGGSICRKHLMATLPYMCATYMLHKGTCFEEPEFKCCGNPVVGAQYMGQQEMICCGNGQEK